MKNAKTNLKKSIIWSLTIFSILMIFTTACKNDDDDTGTPDMLKDIVEVAQGNPDLSSLVNAVVSAGLTDALKADGTLTVFAPTNAAFAKLDEDDLNNILGNPDVLTALLRYHVVSGSVFSTDLSNGSVPTLLSGQSIDIDVSNGVVINGNATVTTADIEASNGVIHIVDEVLIPEDFVTHTITQIALGNPDFSILVSALTKPELSDLLAAVSDPSSDFTVFAPTNDAFEATLAALGKSSIDELPVGLLKEIVSYHIIAGATFSNELAEGNIATLLEGESVEVNLSSGVLINASNVVLPDVEAINGVVHVVDGVLLPGFASETIGTVAEVVLFNPDYTILTAALRIADLLSTVANTEDITVFAPNDEAFAAAGITSLNGLTTEELTPILLYHVVGSKMLSSQLPADGVVATLNAANPNFYLGYLTNDVVLINGLTQVTGVDIEKSNGIIHTINRTLVPPAPNVVEIAAVLADAGDASEFTVLVSLLTSDSLSAVAEALIAAEDVTIFAPTDAAFEAIADLVPTLTAEQLTEILQYHAVSSRVFSTDLSDGLDVTMLSSETTTININGNSVSITDKSGGDNASITEVNIQGSNGLIHVIDKVLLPTL